MGWNFKSELIFLDQDVKMTADIFVDILKRGLIPNGLNDVRGSPSPRASASTRPQLMPNQDPIRHPGRRRTS